MLQKGKNLLLYGGLDRETYHSYLGKIMTHDAKNLKMYSLLCAVGFLGLWIASLISSGFAHINAVIYFVTGAACLVLYFINRILAKRKGEVSILHQVLVYLFMAVLYGEAIVLTMTHKDMPAVTYICVLLVLPLLFAQRPIQLCIFQTVFVMIFCVFTKQYKIESVAAVDVWNGISILCVSYAAILVVVPMRVFQIIYPEKLRELSEKDLLTGLNNRNKFQMDCDRIDSMNRCPICVYADANGLHELNNAKGHAAGDDMLKTIASTMKNVFGETYTYRIGGDEFVSFVFGKTLELVGDDVGKVITEIRTAGYNVSFGYAQPSSDRQPVEKVIKEAENHMYENKRAYYESANLDRDYRF